MGKSVTMHVALVGGGVSNVTLALLLNENFKVTLFERDDALLKKLRRTGNGRANIFNRQLDATFYNDETFMRFHAPHIVATLDAFFAAQKILTYTDEAGRVYPYSESAKVLRENLLKQLKANVKLNTPVTSITKAGTKYLVNEEPFDLVVIATGSSAGLHAFAADNGNNFLFENLGLELVKTVPVIKTLAIQEDVSVLQNIRVKARLDLYENDALLHTEQGELMFKKDGLSGIVSFIVSSYFEWAVKKRPESTYYVQINLMPEYSHAEVKALLKTHDLTTFFDERLIRFFVSKGEKFLVKNITQLTFTLVSGNNPENTQAMSGGVSVNLINQDTFNVQKDPNLFVLGEALNIDGISGGYNLAFAFYSAIKAANYINDTFCQ